MPRISTDAVITWDQHAQPLPGADAQELIRTSRVLIVILSQDIDSHGTWFFVRIHAPSRFSSLPPSLHLVSLLSLSLSLFLSLSAGRLPIPGLRECPSVRPSVMPLFF